MKIIACTVLVLVLVLSLALAMAAPVAAQPAEVWVDDDFDGSTPGWGDTHFDKIQDGIGAVAAGGTVNVAPGTYYEWITVNKPLTLLGANAGLPAADGSGTAPPGRGPESIISKEGINAVRVEAADVTFDGFEFTGANGKLISAGVDSDRLRITNCIFDTPSGHTGAGVVALEGGSKQDVRIDHNLFEGQGEWAWLYFGGHSYANLTINNNDITGTAARGMFQAGTGFVDIVLRDNYFGAGISTGVNFGSLYNPAIHGNYFDGLEIAGLQIGTEGGEVYDNTFKDFVGVDYGGVVGRIGVGLDLFGGQWNTLTCPGLKVHGNTFTDNIQGINIRGGVGGEVGTETRIYGNTITGSDRQGIRIAASGGIEDIGLVEIRFNNIVGNDIGVENSLAHIIDATHNWWGAADGPTTSPGSGDRVSANVNYDHWLGAPLYLPAVYHDTLPAGSHEIDARDQADTVVEFETTGPTDIYVARYDTQPFPDEAFPDQTLGKYVDIHVSDPENVEWPVYVRVYYTTAEVNAAGIDERTLGLYYYSSEDGGFHRCSDTGVNTAEKFIWANITEEEAGYLAGSPFGTGGNPVPPPQPPTAGSAYPIWAVLLAGLMAGLTLLALRRRQIQS